MGVSCQIIRPGKTCATPLKDCLQAGLTGIRGIGKIMSMIPLVVRRRTRVAGHQFREIQLKGVAVKEEPDPISSEGSELTRILIFNASENFPGWEKGGVTRLLLDDRC